MKEILLTVIVTSTAGLCDRGRLSAVFDQHSLLYHMLCCCIMPYAELVHSTPTKYINVPCCTSFKNNFLDNKKYTLKNNMKYKIEAT